MSDLAAERRSLGAFLRDLSADEWEAHSLCEGWTVRDVVAHLTTTTRTGTLAMVAGMLRARGDFHRMTRDRARRVARAYDPTTLIDRLEETADSDRRMPGSAAMDPLLDILVHGQDIARPLGRHRPMPAAPARAALAFAADNPFYDAPARFAGLTLVATDGDWTRPDGPDEVRGNTADLLLVATGRTAGLQALSGPGVAALTRRLTRP